MNMGNGEKNILIPKNLLREEKIPRVPYLEEINDVFDTDTQIRYIEFENFEFNFIDYLFAVNLG